SPEAGGFPLWLGGDNNWRFAVGNGGELLQAGEFDGTTILYTDAFRDLNVLTVNTDRAIDARAATVDRTGGGPDIVMGPFASQGPVHTSRRVFTPQSGDFVRYLDVFANDSDVPVTVKAELRSKSNTTNVYEAVEPNSAEGGWIVYHGSQDNRASVGLVFAGPSASIV